MYNKAKITEWGNVETLEKFYGVAVKLRTNRKWQHCIEDKTPKLFSDFRDAEQYRHKMVTSLQERGLWSE